VKNQDGQTRANNQPPLSDQAAKEKINGTDA